MKKRGTGPLAQDLVIKRCGQMTVIHPSFESFQKRKRSPCWRLESVDFDDHKERTHHQVKNPFWIYLLDASEKNFQPASP